jgi:hypothetical protein
MHGIPAPLGGRYGSEILIMRWMGWGWSELRAAPSALVEEIATRMAAEQRWTDQKRKLDEAKAKRNGR